jgi:SRSO17 transposase
VLSRLPRNAPAWLDRLSEWLEPFEVCFTHVAQRGAFRRYLLGLLSDSRRKSMSAMLERVSDPGTYHAFQHFITDAPWSAERVWRQLRTVIPERRGVLILDGTSFPKTCASSERTSTVFGLIPFAEHIHLANGQVLSIRDYCDPRPMLGGMEASA